MRSPPGCSASSPAIPPTWTACSMRPPTKNPPPSSRGNDMPDTPIASTTATLAELEDHGAFQRRHIGPDEADQRAMLGVLGFGSRAELIDAVVPKSIRRREPMGLGAPRTEGEALTRLRAIAEENQVLKSYIGQGYY